jgi:hypothetical protein
MRTSSRSYFGFMARVPAGRDANLLRGAGRDCRHWHLYGGAADLRADRLFRPLPRPGPSLNRGPEQRRRRSCRRALLGSAVREGPQEPLRQRIERAPHGAGRGRRGHTQLPRHRRSQAPELSDRNRNQRPTGRHLRRPTRTGVKLFDRDSGQVCCRLPEFPKPCPAVTARSALLRSRARLRVGPSTPRLASRLVLFCHRVERGCLEVRIEVFYRARYLPCRAYAAISACSLRR